MTAKSILVSSALAALLLAVPAQAAVITIVNNDDPGEGFNDPTVVPALPGNPATTLGAQRLNVFQAAADVWGGILDSDVEILVDAEINSLFCDETSAVLGSAGTLIVGRDFPGAPFTGTWYPIALVNAILGVDGAPGDADIGARFNGDLDTEEDCLPGLTWWYGIGAPPAPGTLDFFTTVLHEIGHGLGFQTFVDRENGEKFLGFDDAYMHNLESHDTGKHWPDMTDDERVASAINTDDLHWTGVSAVGNSGALIAGVHPSGHLTMYAPDPLELGSSTSHWDTTFTPNELMEPFLTNDGTDIVTTNLLEDIGWNLIGEGCTPNATTLCIDDVPGDSRFAVGVEFDTVLGGGLMGDALATPLQALGIPKGGIFAFTDPANPEILVKVLNGCEITGHYWVFFAATTTVGFDLTVTDTLAEMSKTYTNPDLMAAETITDTMAFATCP